MCTGGGHSKLEETSIVGVPVMTKKSFIDTERDIGEMWKQALQQSMLEAGRREREIAIQKGHFHEGVPTITVIVAGARGLTSIHIMPSLVWPSSLAKRLESFFILESATSFVMHAQGRFQRKPHLLHELDSILI